MRLTCLRLAKRLNEVKESNKQVRLDQERNSSCSTLLDYNPLSRKITSIVLANLWGRGV